MSVPIFDHLSAIRECIAASPHLLVGLDYDGTLTPIVDDPTRAYLSSETRELIKGIAALPNTSVAIISGRRLSDVRTLVDIDGLIYAGNHGLEISGPKFGFLEPTAAKMQRALGWLGAALTRNLSQVAGARVENKVLTLSVHCRQVAAAERPVVLRHVHAAASVAPERFRINSGKLVFDVYPRVDWNKGSAMNWIVHQLATPNTLTLYIGDDRTDEDAFQSIHLGITIKVGEEGETAAQYHLKDPAAVRDFLAWMTNRASDLDSIP